MQQHATESISPSERSWGQLAFNILLAVVIVGLLITYSMALQVSEGTNAVVTRFGKPVREVTEPGLHWKAPVPVEQSHVIDMRKRLFNTPYTATLTRDRKNVIILTYVVWRVEQPLLFLQSVGTPETAEDKLKGMERWSNMTPPGCSASDLSTRISRLSDNTFSSASYHKRSFNAFGAAARP